MWNLNTRAILILLGASCLLSAAEEGGKLMTTRSKRPSSNSAFKLLNDYLVKQVDSNDLKANIEAARKYTQKSSAGQQDQIEGEVKELAELLARLDADDVCGLESIANKRAVVKALLRIEPRMFKAKSATGRLSVLMHNCILQAQEVCFTEFEQQWLANGRAIDTDFNKNHMFAAISEFDSANLLDPEPKPRAKRADVRQLQAAMDRFHDLKYGDSSLEITIKELAKYGKQFKELLAWASPASKRPAPRAAKRSLEEAIEFVDQFYYAPCTSFVERPESKSLLKPVGELADLVTDLSKLEIKPIGSETQLLTFVWASRYYSCLRQLGIDKLKMAEAVFKAQK